MTHIPHARGLAAILASLLALMLIAAQCGGTVSSQFSMTVDPRSATVAQGSTGSTTITVTPTGGFDSDVQLAVQSTLPSGVTASFDPNPVAGGDGTSTLTLAASPSAEVVTDQAVEIEAQGGTARSTTELLLTVVSGDTTSPTVVDTNPVAGASSVSVETDIIVEFSEPMDSASVEGAFGTTPTVSCSNSWNADLTVMTCQPSSALDAGTTYDVTVASSAQDAAGNTLPNDYQFSFTTVEVVTTIASVDSQGDQGSEPSGEPAITPDGRYVVFASNAQLVPDDSGPLTDVYLRDQTNGTTERLSVNGSGVAGDGGSQSPRISDDGRFVAFDSLASNLVANDTNGEADVFVRDRDTGTTERVSLNSDGSEANGASQVSAISADGNYVVFQSLASNLVDGDSNGVFDVFLHDRASTSTVRVSIADSGTEGDGESRFGSISADGTLVVFSSYATNLVENDTNETQDVFLRDMSAGTTERINVSSTGAQANDHSRTALPDYAVQAISDDGTLIVFSSGATNLVSDDTNVYEDVFVRNRSTGTTTRLSVDSAGNESNGHSSTASISGDGHIVVFESQASNLVADDTVVQDIFMRERSSGTTSRVNVTPGDDLPTEDSLNASVSLSGGHVAYESLASNLVENDTNGATADVFVARIIR